MDRERPIAFPYDELYDENTGQKLTLFIPGSCTWNYQIFHA
jgi:hypothetical protein